MIRVVADTNIYISALVFGGLPGTVLELGLARAIQLIASAEILEELDEKLRGKFRVGAEDAATIRPRLGSYTDIPIMTARRFLETAGVPC